MTYQRFKQLWAAAGLNDRIVGNPIAVDEMSSHTIDALLAAAEGDFSTFEKAREIATG